VAGPGIWNLRSLSLESKTLISIPWFRKAGRKKRVNFSFLCLVVLLKPSTDLKIPTDAGKDNVPY
jgi:hypothetical protein